MIFRYKRIYLYYQAITILTAPYSTIKEFLFPFRSTKRKDFPDFLVIGAHKAGTTWIYENLKKHPQLFLPQKKEVHYFDHGFYHSLRWYLDHFKNASDRLKGEITPAYAILGKSRIRHIHKLNPDLKIIFVVRNPIERAWSHALNNFCIGMAVPYENLTSADFKWHFSSYASRIRSDYCRTIESWCSVFPMENIHICYYEDLKNYPENFLSSIFSFLGVERPLNWQEYPFNRVVNKGPSYPVPAEQLKMLRDIYDPEIKKMKSCIGTRSQEWLVTP